MNPETNNIHAVKSFDGILFELSCRCNAARLTQRHYFLEKEYLKFCILSSFCHIYRHSLTRGLPDVSKSIMAGTSEKKEHTVFRYDIFFMINNIYILYKLSKKNIIFKTLCIGVKLYMCMGALC